MNGKRMLFLWIPLIIAAMAGAAVCAVMLVMAVRFGEWGRVVFYLFLAAICLEAAIFSGMKLWEIRKPKT